MAVAKETGGDNEMNIIEDAEADSQGLASLVEDDTSFGQPSKNASALSLNKSKGAIKHNQSVSSLKKS